MACWLSLLLDGSLLPLIWGTGSEDYITIRAMTHKDSGENTELCLTCHYPLLNSHQVPGTTLDFSFALSHLNLTTALYSTDYCLHFRVMGAHQHDWMLHLKSPSQQATEVRCDSRSLSPKHVFSVSYHARLTQLFCSQDIWTAFHHRYALLSRVLNSSLDVSSTDHT